MVSSWTGPRLETAMRANGKEGSAGSASFPSNASIRRLLLVVSILYYLVLEYFGLEKQNINPGLYYKTEFDIHKDKIIC